MNMIQGLKNQNISLSMVDISNVSTKVERHGYKSYNNLLTDWESTYINNIKIPKRRHDFLSGRLAGKRAIKEHLAQNEVFIDRDLRFNDIEIIRLNTGKPLIRIMSKRTEYLISISHSGHFAASTVCSGRNFKGIGTDIEKIEKRGKSFLDVAYNENEIINLMKHYHKDDNVSNPQFDINATRYWAIKESILKSLGIGLNVDLKDIEIIESMPGEMAFKMKNDVKRRCEKLQVNESNLNVESFIVNDSYVVSISYLL